MQNAAFWFRLILLIFLFAVDDSAGAFTEISDHPKTNKESKQSGGNQNRPIDVRPVPSTPYTKGGLTAGKIQENPKPAKYDYKCDPSPSKDDADSCEQRRSTNATVNQFYTSIVGALVGAVAAFYTYRAARAAAVAAETAKIQIDMSQKMSEAELRAYVYVKHVRIKNIHAGERPIGEVAIQNFGATPAHKCRMWAGIAMLDNFSEYSLKIPDEGVNIAEGVLVNGQAYILAISFALPISADQISSIRAGEFGIYIYGGVNYVDVFGKERVSKFRYVLGHGFGFPPNGAMHIHSSGNEAT